MEKGEEEQPIPTSLDAKSTNQNAEDRCCRFKGLDQQSPTRISSRRPENQILQSPAEHETQLSSQQQIHKWTGFIPNPGSLIANSTKDKDFGSFKILVPIANGSEEMEAAIIIDVLRANAQVVVASGRYIGDCFRKVKLVTDVLHPVEAAKQSYDLIVLPGGLGGAEKFAKSEKLVDMLKKQREIKQTIWNSIASPALGKKATAFPACAISSPSNEAENRNLVVDGEISLLAEDQELP
ncbi:hypothetical protein HAX54_010583 [Datura stramonium]|uniref:DJ-1/PfpI domain-containing protein n=1 Tax=Datura stramonium TaxID=4076 RepID=A0ABS8TGH5_DATST|nr:hypothetical protein [Datura stramonium]